MLAFPAPHLDLESSRSGIVEAQLLHAELLEEKEEIFVVDVADVGFLNIRRRQNDCLRYHCQCSMRAQDLLPAREIGRGRQA